MKYLIVFLLFRILSISAQNLNCYAPDSTPGSCMSFRYCTYVLELIYNSSQNQSAIEAYLRKSICGYDGIDLLVCCPAAAYTTTSTTPSSLFFFSFFGTQAPPPSATADPNAFVNGRYVLPNNDANKCGMTNATHTRVVGGVNAQLNGWPWIALLGFRAPTDTVVRYQCGGTLITQRHVTTAAHCIKDTLTLVRLGEYDITSDNDGAFPVDIGIEWKKAHEAFDPKLILNDIGLIKLNVAAPFTDKIRPICLPVSEPIRSKDITYYQPFVAGWGSLSFKGPLSAILQEVQLPIVPTAECGAAYQALYPQQVFDNRILCAGFTVGGKDSCQGDSGGPLMLPNLSTDQTYYYWNLVGIVSYGYECARPGFPGVYTRVTTFIPWIESHLND